METLLQKRDNQLIEDILIDPGKFFAFVRNEQPYDYQTVFLKDNAKRIAIRSGRQIGKTVMGSVKVLYRAFMNPNEQILILAPSQRQANIFFWNIKEIVANNLFIKECVVRETMTQIYFDNGSEIHCLPAGSRRVSDRIRGFSPTLILMDEASYIPDEVLTAVEPSLAATNGDLIYTSTPYGKRGFFWECFKPGGGFSTYHIKSSECPRITEDFLKEKKERLSENEFNQEYLGEFSEEGDVFFTRSLILSCTEDIKELDNPQVGYVYYLGIDCARYSQDETVYTIVEHGAFNRVVKIVSTSKQPTTDITARIKQLYEIWKFECIHIDATNVGGPVYDILIQEGYPIFPAKFASIKFKEQLYMNLKTLMEHHKIQFPNNEKLINQMANLISRFTMQGVSLQPPDKGHDNFPDSLTLAVRSLSAVDYEDNESLYIR
jgi:hypothetical protein